MPSIGPRFAGHQPNIPRTETTMSSSDTDRIRALNDELRLYLYNGGVFLTPGIAALGKEAISRLANAIATFDDFFAPPMIPTASTTLARSISKAHPSFSKSIITTKTGTSTLQIQQTRPSRSGSSQSCWLRSTRLSTKAPTKVAGENSNR